MAGTLDHPRARLVQRKPRTVRTVARERVEDVRDRDDAPFEWNRLAFQTVGIAASVPALVVRPGDRRGELEQVAAGAGEQVAADLRVPLHLLALVVGQHPGLAQDLVVDRDLADVVQRRREAQQRYMRVRQAERDRDVTAVRADALEVGAGCAVAIFDRAGEAVQRSRVRALQREVGRFSAVGLEPAPVQGVRDVDDQVVRRERLRHVPEGTQPKRGVDDALVVLTGDHDRCDVGSGPCELVEQLEARAAGKRDVAQHNGEVLAREQIARTLDGADTDAVVAGGEHDASDHRPHLRVVVDA